MACNSGTPSPYPWLTHMETAVPDSPLIDRHQPATSADHVATQAEPLALAQQLYDYRFSVAMGTAPRSQAYKDGFMDGVSHILYRKPIACRYTMGTAEDDAHMYGVDEGRETGKCTLEAFLLPARFYSGQLVMLRHTRQRGRVKSWFTYWDRRVYVVDFGEDIGVSATSYAEETSLMGVKDPAP